MALLKPMRCRWAIHDANGQVRIPLILAATLGVSLITAASSTLRLALALQNSPGKWPDLSSQDFFAYLLGVYLGALTLTPLVLALRERIQMHRGEAVTISTIWRSALLRDTLWWVLPTVAGLAWIAISTHDESIRLVARMALLWPVIGLAWRYGWHGAATGGMVASLALAMTAPGPLDPATIRVQVVLSLAISGCLWMGAHAIRHPRTLTAPASPRR
ncbi:hypothetical protein KCV01_g3240, partial [Aureobasidium melanogenum]